MATNQNVLAVISSLVTCVQLNVAVFTVHLNYVKQRFEILRALMVSDGLTASFGPLHWSKKSSQTYSCRFCVFCLYRGIYITNNKANYLHFKKTNNLTLFDTNTNLPPMNRLLRMSYWTIFREESLTLEWIRMRADGVIRFVSGYVRTRKLLHPERKVYGFKSIQICVDRAL